MAEGQQQEQSAEAPEPVPVGDDIAAAIDELGWTDDIEETEQSEADDAEKTEAETGEAAVEASEGDQEDADDAEAAADDDEEGDEPDGVDAPEHWSQSDKDVYAALPDEAKQPYLDARKSLERGYHAKFEALSEDARAGTELRDVFQPFQAQLDREGIDRVGALRRLVAAHDLLTRDADQGLPWLAGQTQYRPKDPAATVKAIATAWGVDLGASPDEGQADDDFIDPMAKKEITALKAKVSELEQHNSTTTEAEQQRRMGDAQATFQAFTDAKDEAGKPKHPHFGKVRTRMGVLMRDGMADTLEDAYEQAVWSDPALRGDLLKSQQVTQKAKADEKARLDRNKRAARTVKSDKSGGQAAPVDRSLRDEITAEFDKAGIT